MAENLEIEEQQVVSQVDGDGGKKEKLPKVAPSVQLYNDILSLKEPGFSDEYKKIGYKKFNSLLTGDEEFQNALLTDLNERGFGISPEQFAGTYLPAKGQAEVYDFSAVEKPTAAPEVTKEDEGFFGQIKGFAKSVYGYGKDFYNTVKRDIYTGKAQEGAQVEDFLMGKVDTKNLAHYLKKAHEVGDIQIEAEYAKDEGVLKDAADLALMLGPAIVGSFSSMVAAGGKKMLGMTAAGAAAGAGYGAATGLAAGGIGAAPGAVAGAITGAGRGAQVAMVQQGYNLEFASSVIDELTEKGAIDPNADEATLKKQLDDAFANKQLMKPIYEKANTRAGIIMGVDIAASGIGGKVIGTLRRAAMSKPVAKTAIGRVLQQSARAAAQTAPARAAVKMAERAAQVGSAFSKTKLGKSLDVIDAMDITAGAGGEALAQLKTEGKIDWKEVTLEGGAEGSYIKALRALGDIGNKKQELLGLPQARTPEALPSGPEAMFSEVTQEEFDNYKKGVITPTRASDIVTDVDIAIEDPSHLEKLKGTNPLYAEMVTDAFNKHIVAVENQKLYNVALDDVAELNGISAEEVRMAITPNAPEFNQKIADDFRNSFNVLQKQYREKAQNDSQDAAGVSSEVGGGKESEPTESQQGAGQEAAGDGGVFQEAEGEERLAEIDELLADDDAFFAQNNDRLLSPEERQDLIKERETIAGPQVAPTTGLSTGATPAAAPAQVVAPANAPATEAAPVVEQAEVVTETAASQQPATSKPDKKAKSTTTAATKPAAKEVKAADVEIRKGKTHATDGVYEAVYKGKVIGKMTFDKKEKVWVDAAGDKFAQKKDAVEKFVLRYNMMEEGKTATSTKPAETKKQSETKPETKAEVKPESENKGAAKMPTAIQDAYAKRATLRITADALVKQMGGKKLSGKAQKELDGVNAEIQKLDNLINAFEKERARQRAESEKAKAEEKKPEAKKEQKQPTTISGGTEKEIAYGNYLINELVSRDPEGEKSRQIYVDGWNDVNKNKTASKANSFLEDVLVNMLPSDKQPTGYADIRDAFRNAQEKAETKTETKSESVSANDVKSLTKVNEELFGLDKEKASAAATVMDSMIGQMAKRAGVTKEEMYAKLEFRKATAKGLPKGVKLQLDAWHGSPYQFAKFLLENIDTGEGAQAFGWGLYFTDLQDIATYYANSVSNQNLDSDIAKAKSVIVEDFYDNGKSENLIDAMYEATANEFQKTDRQILAHIADVLGNVARFPGVKPSSKLFPPSIIKAIINNKDVLGDIGKKAVYKANLFAGKKRYVVAPIQSLDQKWNVYDSQTWEQVHRNPYPLSSVEATAKALRDSFDDGEKFLVLKHITGALRQNLNDLQYLVESENDLDIAKKIKPLQASITEEMERINKTNIRSEINFKQELKKFKSKFDEIRELFDSLEENSKSINQMKEAFLEVSEDGVNAWIAANSQHKAKKYHEAKAKGDNAPIIGEVEKTVGTGTQGMLDDLERVTPEKRFNSKEEALSWINDNNEYTFLEWDKPISIANLKKIKNQAAKEGINNFPNIEGRLKETLNGVNGLYSDAGAFYNELKNAIASAEQTSKFLLRAGIDGIKYPAESIAAGRTSDNARGFNYVIFDENAINIEDVIKFQKDANKARGAVMVGMDGQAVIYALTNPNVSTPLHELAHVYEHYLSDAEKDTVLKSAGTKEWNTETSEYFARGFEKYLAEGKSPNEALSKVFEKFKQWLGDIYKGIKGSPIDVKLNKEMRKIYAQMLGAEETKTTGKQEVKTEVKTEVKAETPTPSAKVAPTFSEFDAISADRGKMKEAKAAFIEKHGQLAYDAMKEISANFTKITKALQEKEILTKKC